MLVIGLLTFLALRFLLLLLGEVLVLLFLLFFFLLGVLLLLAVEEFTEATLAVVFLLREGSNTRREKAGISRDHLVSDPRNSENGC